MKALSMAILSPGRPPPSRSSVGNRSRSSRSAPVFYRRNGAGKMESSGDQEPYSPKVTCIGQVRARNSGWRRCCWFWGRFLSARRRVFRRVLRKWVVFLRSGYCKKVDAVAEEDCFSVGRRKFENVLEIRVAENGRDLDDSCCSTAAPRNGLMLTRCSRSAPYRASSLGEIFRRENNNIGGDQLLQSSEDGVARIPQQGSENPRNHNVSVRDSEGIAVHPLILTRCKSEPATIRERFHDFI